MNLCVNCGNKLSLDEISLYRKLIYREADQHECLCIKCLARKLGVGEDALIKKIAFFKKIGCTLFTK